MYQSFPKIRNTYQCINQTISNQTNNLWLSIRHINHTLVAQSIAHVCQSNTYMINIKMYHLHLKISRLCTTVCSIFTYKLPVLNAVKQNSCLCFQLFLLPLCHLPLFYLHNRNSFIHIITALSFISVVLNYCDLGIETKILVSAN